MSCIKKQILAYNFIVLSGHQSEDGSLRIYSDLSKVKNSVQKVAMNLPSLSLTILVGTRCLKKKSAVNSAEDCLVVGMKVAYFENRSMISKMASRSPTFWRCVIQSMDTLSHGLVGTGKGSRSPATFAFSILSCWQMRHVFVYCMTSSLILGQK